MVDCSDAKSKVSEQKILSVVSAYYSLSVAQITGKIKSGNIVNARHVAIYLFRDLLDLPLKKIGAIFGGRDHTTIMHSIEKIDKLLKTDEQTQTAIKEDYKFFQECVILDFSTMSTKLIIINLKRGYINYEI